MHHQVWPPNSTWLDLGENSTMQYKSCVIFFCTRCMACANTSHKRKHVCVSCFLQASNSLELSFAVQCLQTPHEKKDPPGWCIENRLQVTLNQGCQQRMMSFLSHGTGGGQTSLFLWGISLRWNPKNLDIHWSGLTSWPSAWYRVGSQLAVKQPWQRNGFH